MDNVNPKLSKLVKAGSVVTVGNFDGVHIGHQSVLKKLIATSKKLEKKSIVVTFSPNPRKVFSTDGKSVNVSSLGDRLRLLRKIGVDIVYIIKFNQEYAKTTAQEFIQKTLQATLNAQEILIGENFHFGYKRQGDVKLLKGSFNVEVVELLKDNKSNQKYTNVSSTLIRGSLASGDMEKVYQFLGRHYSLNCIVHEDDNLNLIANLNKYTEIKTGLYWAKVDGNIKTFPVKIMQQRLIISPLEGIPDIQVGKLKLELLERVEI